MLTETTARRDVMQVCLHGHVITDRLRGQPAAARGHCDRCGASTLTQCLTCGTPLPGAAELDGFETVGSQRPPDFCAGCGGAFPWTAGHGPPQPLDLLAPLAALLRRLPQVIRALRSRHGHRPAFRVEDDHDLADLLRGLLCLHFEVVRPHQRTPSYSATTRTDLWLLPDGVALVAKCCLPEARLAEQWQEDLAYYARRPDCRCLLGLVYDPERRIANALAWEQAWSKRRDILETRSVIVG